MLNFNEFWLIDTKNLIILSKKYNELSEKKAEIPIKIDKKMGNNGLGILEIKGSLFKNDNILTDFGYGMSYESIANMIDLYNSDPNINNILLKIDSPGGEASGLDEIGNKIRQNPKPIYSFVSGMAASAGYWLASATKKIYISPMSYAGSIGTILSMVSLDKAYEDMGIKQYTFVSEVSPKKEYNPDTEQGKESIQKLVNELGLFFVDKVSEYRDKSKEDVLRNFGQGEVLLASKAKEVGMVDKISYLNDAITDIRSNNVLGGYKMTSEKAEPTVKETLQVESKQPEITTEPVIDKNSISSEYIRNNFPTIFLEIKEEARTEERSRIESLDTLTKAFPYYKNTIDDAKYKTFQNANDVALLCANLSIDSKDKMKKSLDEGAKDIALDKVETKESLSNSILNMYQEFGRKNLRVGA